jgi:hypothetical protein
VDVLEPVSSEEYCGNAGDMQRTIGGEDAAIFSKALAISIVQPVLYLIEPHPSRVGNCGKVTMMKVYR